VGRHYARRLAVFCEPGFLGLREVLQSADARFANLESMVVRYVEGTPTLRTGTPSNSGTAWISFATRKK